MAHPSNAQTIVPVTQVCKTFSANRPCALFIRVPPECTLNASCRLSVCCDVVGVFVPRSPLARSNTGRAIHRCKASRYLRTCCIISSTVDIVRQCRDALRLSKDYFGRSRENVAVLRVKERMFCERARTCYRVNDLRWLTTVAAGDAARFAGSHLLAQHPLAARSAT